MTTEKFHNLLTSLAGAWCDRRCYSALKHLLQGWPLSDGLTDDWARLLNALKNIRTFAKAELTKDELNIVDELVRVANKVVSRTY